MVVMVPGGQGSAAIQQHWGRSQVSHPAQSPRHSSQSGVGLRALGPRGSSGGAAGGAQGGPP